MEKVYLEKYKKRTIKKIVENAICFCKEFYYKLSGVRLAEQGQRFDNLCKVSGNKKRPRWSFFGGLPGTRTPDPLIKSQLLYQLS